MLNLLKKNFGYDRFRPLQEEIVENVLAENDTVVLMPTGSGKSLCYQLPALRLEGLTIVISPLISLMKDQVDALQGNGISATFINSTLSLSEIASIKRQAVDGSIKILYVAPERFAVASFRDFLHTLRVSLIAVDEAHCISEWGHDFRPDYRNLKNLRSFFPDTPIIGLTATATKKVQEDIVEQLNLDNPQIFISSFNRANLTYIVQPKRNAFRMLLDLLQKHKDESAIIYCFSRKNTESVAGDLRSEGFNAMPYHAGLDNETRRETQERFIRDEIPIVVATVAFGMGIDKPDVRLIVHYDLPKSLEGYYQETGRSGRDGLPSECVLFYSYGDKIKQDFFIDQIADKDEREKAQKKLRQVIDFCELNRCRRRYLIEYFGETWKEGNCGGCDVCLSPRELFDASIVSQKILSCVLRTGERFGASYIIDVLCGKGNKKVCERGHDRLSVFGIVKDFGKEELRQITGSLIENGLLVKHDDRYPTLRMTNSGREFLKQKRELLLPEPKVECTVVDDRSAIDGEFDPVLFEDLRILRKKIADEKEVPPFVVFGDVALREMAARYPQSLDGFSRISGVGAKKLATFGERFLAVISSYAKKHGKTEMPVSFRSTRKKSVVKKTGSSYKETKKMVQQKLPVAEIVRLRGLTETTILSHLEKLAENNGRLEMEYLKPLPERFKKIRSAFQQSGGWALKPVKEILGGEFSYNELKLVRIFLR